MTEKISYVLMNAQPIHTETACKDTILSKAPVLKKEISKDLRACLVLEAATYRFFLNKFSLEGEVLSKTSPWNFY